MTKSHQGLWWLHDGHHAIQRGEWKLVANKGAPWELYNIMDDRAEQNNLASKYPDRVSQLANAWRNLADQFSLIRDGATENLEEGP